MVLKGWPEKRDECPQNFRAYWSYRDELSVLHGLVLKGTRIIIPNDCRNDVLDKVHEGHFRIERMKLRAWDTMYWLQINHDIETLVKSCDKCQEFSKRNNRDPDIPREIPLVPWSLLEMDLFPWMTQLFYWWLMWHPGFQLLEYCQVKQQTLWSMPLKEFIVILGYQEGYWQPMGHVLSPKNL